MAKTQKTIDQALNTPTPSTTEDAAGIYNRNAGPSKDERTGLTAVRNPAAGPITIENGGTAEAGDWVVLDSNGVRLNGTITAAATLAYWLKQNGLARRVENLDALGFVEAHKTANGGGGYNLADVALGKR